VREDNTKQLDYVYAVGYDDIITEVIEDLNSNPKLLTEA
jgi:hypothetical protein